MNNGTADRVIIGIMAQNLLRIVIASYFIAVSLNLIPGTNLATLFTPVAPPLLAEVLAKSTVFILAFCVMIGIWMRGAALILGLLTFFASYITMLDLGMADELGGFWRDLALIAALVLSYSETAPRDHRRRRMIRRRVTPRRIVVAKPAPQPQPHATPVPLVAFASRRKSEPATPFLSVVARNPDVDNIFADEAAALVS